MGLMLLASVAVAITAWVTRTLTVQEQKLADAESDRSASIFERALRADLMSADAGIAAAAGVGHRVWVERSVLHVLCRDRGPARASYALDRGGDAIIRSARSIGDGDPPEEDVIALGVADLTWELNKPETIPHATLIASWTDASGDQRELRIMIDKEWIP